MSFTYEQSTGNLLHYGGLMWTGYSGHAPGINDPAMQDVKDVGPIPRGRYTIQPPHASEKVGPVAMALLPHHENEMHGRGDFLIHGDTAAMNRTASHGCIIMPLATRTKIGEAVAAGDDTLEVIA